MIVDEGAQAAFVALSGDANPLHTDPLVARRLPFGRPAVHGVHLALLALERHGEATGALPGRVRATFRSPVGVGDPIDVMLDRDVARLHVRDRLVADVRVEPGSHGSAGLVPVGTVEPPEEHSLADLIDRHGPLGLAGDATAISARFPHVPVGIAATLLAITRLVGMRVPGLHSMLSSFDVAFDGEPIADLRYAVTDVDDRFSKVTIAIGGRGMSGSVTAFVRPAPSDPIVDTDGVVPGEFAGTRALVVGGSRGLGAAAVQLLAAGGAEVRFTYHRGADDAARVAAHAPGSTAHPLDVERDALDAVTAGGWQPGLLAWFASPPIFVGSRDAYSDELFARFHSVYVDAFAHAAEHLHRLDAILWPSSEAVEHPVPGMAEYADAKRAGEAACAALRQRRPHLRVVAPRFPRLRTDQTATFVPVETDDPAAYILAALRDSLAGHPDRPRG